MQTAVYDHHYYSRNNATLLNVHFHDCWKRPKKHHINQGKRPPLTILGIAGSGGGPQVGSRNCPGTHGNKDGPESGAETQ